MLLKQNNKLIDTLLNLEKEELQRNSGKFCAKCFQFFFQFNSSQIVKKLFFTKVPYKNLYQRHSIAFDKIASLFYKYDYDVLRYMQFCVSELNMLEKDIDENLANPKTIQDYIDYLQNQNKLQIIYRSIVKTSEFIADECYKNKFKTCKDYIKYIIQSKKMCAYYLSGHISKYFLAMIPNFNIVISHLDHFSRLELSDLEKMFNIYNIDAVNACIQFGSKKINPFGFTDELIQNKRCKNDEQLYDENL